MNAAHQRQLCSHVDEDLSLYRETIVRRSQSESETLIQFFFFVTANNRAMEREFYYSKYITRNPSLLESTPTVKNLA